MNLGLMQDFELTIPSILEHAAQNHGDTEIVARMVDGAIHRYNYREMANRSRQLAGSLSRVGVKYGDMVGTLAWNNHWHMECFYGIPGIGAVCHTVNPRLFKDQIIYIINHANDKILMVDMDFVDLAEDICDDIPNIETFVILGRKGDITHPQKLKNVLYYENLIETESTNFEWSELEEKTASGLCYTSGTTGNPKGVLYSHRSTILHSMAIAQPDNLSLSAADCVMPVAPLYHAQSWGLPYGAAMVGAKFVLPGNRLDGPNLLELIHREKVTTGCGVPTIWTSVLEHAETMGEDLNPLERLLIGGTALPTIIRDKMKKHGVNPVQIWGMTETSPLGTIGRPNRKVIDTMDESETAQQMLKQGRLPYGVQMKVVLADGAIAPHDGETSGDLWVKGPWIASAYLNHDKDLLDAEGFFPTGDVGCIDSYGYMRITDRSKDVIKSGGEWISSIDIEDIANSHPKVSLAAVVASYHSKWDERPLLFIKLRDDESMEKQEMFDYLIGKIAKWWTPDDVLFIEEMPLTATGKIRKLDLREKFWNHLEA